MRKVFSANQSSDGIKLPQELLHIQQMNELQNCIIIVNLQIEWNNFNLQMNKASSNLTAFHHPQSLNPS